MYLLFKVPTKVVKMYVLSSQSKYEVIKKNLFLSSKDTTLYYIVLWSMLKFLILFLCFWFLENFIRKLLLKFNFIKKIKSQKKSKNIEVDVTSKKQTTGVIAKSRRIISLRSIAHLLKDWKIQNKHQSYNTDDQSLEIGSISKILIRSLKHWSRTISNSRFRSINNFN